MNRILAVFWFRTGRGEWRSLTLRTKQTKRKQKKTFVCSTISHPFPPNFLTFINLSHHISSFNYKITVTFAQITGTSSNPAIPKTPLAGKCPEVSPLPTGGEEVLRGDDEPRWRNPEPTFQGCHPGCFNSGIPKNGFGYNPLI